MLGGFDAEVRILLLLEYSPQPLLSHPLPPPPPTHPNCRYMGSDMMKFKHYYAEAKNVVDKDVKENLLPKILLDKLAKADLPRKFVLDPDKYDLETLDPVTVEGALRTLHDEVISVYGFGDDGLAKKNIEATRRLNDNDPRSL